MNGYWTRKDNRGVAMVLFATQDAAIGASERIRLAPPAGVTIEDSEVREVVAHA